jgi:hypothetical protein
LDIKRDIDMDTDIGSWQPIVVDVATMPFEPRAPKPSEYRPDIICDGWSTSDFLVRVASVRGYGHRFCDLPRQDAVEVRAHPPTGTVTFAVADGVSSARESDVGAVVACEAVTVAMLHALDRDPERVDWFDIVRRTVSAMGGRLGGGADIEKRFATTLVAGIVQIPPGGGARATIIQVGDSSAWLFYHGQFSPVLDHKMAGHPTFVSSGVVPLPRMPDEVRPVEVEVAPDAVLLIGTDGFGDPLGDGTGLVGQLFAKALRSVPPPLGMAHLLDFSRETFDDDRTLVAVWPRVGLAGSP